MSASPTFAALCELKCRPGGTRTPNLRIWSPMHCQLCYGPSKRSALRVSANVIYPCGVPCAFYRRRSTSSVRSEQAQSAGSSSLSSSACHTRCTQGLLVSGHLEASTTPLNTPKPRQKFRLGFSVRRGTPNSVSPLVQLLLDDLGDDARTYGTATLTNREAKPFVHRDRHDHVDRDSDVLTRHAHLGALGQVDDARYVRRAEVELRTVSVEERRVSTTSSFFST